MKTAWVIGAAVVLAATATPALAYVGPGAGLSLLGALWGLLAAVFAAVGYIVMWPVRHMLRRRRCRDGGAQGARPRGAPTGHDDRSDG